MGEEGFELGREAVHLRPAISRFEISDLKIERAGTKV
jgi:hypothetical protein